MGSFGTIKSEASQTTGKNPSGKLFYGVRLNSQYSIIMPVESMRITVV
jgi:plasmid maintenance system killer protein